MTENPRKFLVHRIELSRGRTVEAWEAGPLVAGQEAPALVLIPGVAGGKEIFATSVPELATERRVIAVDLCPLVPPDALAAAAQDLWEVLDALGVNAVDLLGQSFGAIVAVRAQRLRPTVVRRVVLVAPATVPAARDAIPVLARWAFYGGALRLWPTRGRAAAIRWIQRRGGYALEPSLSAGDLDALFDRVKRTPVLPLLRRLLALRGHRWSRDLNGLATPLLVMEGDREWAILPAPVRELFERHPGARVVLLPGGHMPFLTNVREFGREVRAFLTEEAGAGESERPSYS